MNAAVLGPRWEACGVWFGLLMLRPKQSLLFKFAYL